MKNEKRKMKKYFILFALFSFFLINCSKEEKEKLERMENILPGEWNIETFYIPKYGTGLYYKGKTIYKDTVLTNVGTMKIPEFIIENLDLNASRRDTISYILTIDNEIFTFNIEALFLSGTDYFAYFRPDGLFGNSEAQKFLDSSRLFYMNAEIVIEDENNIQIHKSGERNKYYLALSRK